MLWKWWLHSKGHWKLKTAEAQDASYGLIYESSRRQDSGCMTLMSFLIFTFVQKGKVVILVRFKHRTAQSSLLIDEAAFWLEFPFKDPAQIAETKHTSKPRCPLWVKSLFEQVTQKLATYCTKLTVMCFSCLCEKKKKKVEVDKVWELRIIAYYSIFMVHV